MGRFRSSRSTRLERVLYPFPFPLDFRFLFVTSDIWVRPIRATKSYHT